MRGPGAEQEILLCCYVSDLGKNNNFIFRIPGHVATHKGDNKVRQGDNNPSQGDNNASQGDNIPSQGDNVILFITGGPR